MFASHYPISEAGIWADCCREKRALCFNDYAAYAAKRGLPDGHTPLQRLISVPVIEHGAVRMIVGVGNRIAAYDDLDVETVQMIANAVWSVVQRARAEAALARRLAEVTELNGKLEDAHLQLLQSEKMSAIGQLAAGVAHELNNPIGFVYSNLGTLAEYVEDLLAIDAAYGRVEEQLPALAGPGVLDEVRRLKGASDHPYLVEDLPKLIQESKEGLERVHKIVLDLRDFSRVGESEWQWTDLEKGLESTINIVWNELKYKADVERQYTLAAADPLPGLAAQPGVHEPAGQRRTGHRNERQDRHSHRYRRRFGGCRRCCRLGLGGSRGQRARHVAGGPETRVRAFLHHQAGRQRDRAGPLDCIRDRRQAPWSYRIPFGSLVAVRLFASPCRSTPARPAWERALESAWLPAGRSFRSPRADHREGRASMTFINWSPHFVTGIELVDRQHYGLVDLINAVAPLLACQEPVLADEVEILLDRLAAYAVTHFRDEEQLMGAAGMDAASIGRQVTAHRGFVEEIGIMRRAVDANGQIDGACCCAFWAIG
jgi:hemerythrin-like metal-binding protein